MLTLTEKAAAKFKELAAETTNPEKQVLRVSYVGMCCGGPTWHLSLDNFQCENDMIAEHQGITIAYSRKKEQVLEDAIIDYSDKKFSEGFYLKTPGQIFKKQCPINN